MEWHFRQQTPGDTTRDPIASEFFSTEAIEDPANALVREAIQNALDAKRADPVGIRVFLALGRHAASSSKASRWLAGARPHLTAPRNGLLEVPEQGAACPYLVIEDFGTTGLQGPVHQAFEEEGTRNPFFYFFRAEGLSDKGEGDRGRWGIGKTVFPRSSRISTYFGYTIRADDRQHLLMGRSVLKTHRLAGANYTPDGYYGERENERGLVLPVADTHSIAQFCSDFGISRKDEPGLSIVVPFVDPEITLESVTEAAIAEYFWPILKRTLVVRIQTPDSDLLIDADGLTAAIQSLPTKAAESLAPVVALTRWAISESPGGEYRLRSCTDDNPVWSGDLIPNELLSRMHRVLNDGGKLAIRVGVQVRENAKPPATSFFGAYLCQDDFRKGVPIFIREGMILSDLQRLPRSPGIRSLVVVEAGALSALLGDSENPAHTQWQANSSHFKNKYAHGRNHINFVKGIVSNIVNALAALDQEEDRSLFADIFSLPAEAPETFKRGMPASTDEDEGDTSPTGFPPIQPREKEFRISRVDGGWRLGPGDVPIRAKARLRIEAAYDTRTGNPLRKYLPADFVLDKPPITLGSVVRAVSIVTVANNAAVVEILDPDFELVATGFDKERDLFVKATFAEPKDDQAT